MAENKSVVKENQNPNDVKITLKGLSKTEKKEKISELTDIIRTKGLSENDAVQLSISVINSVENILNADDLIKKFADSKSSFIGSTSKDGKGTNKHNHDYAVILLSYAKDLVGITTSTSNGESHVHRINLGMDRNIKSIEAYTDYGVFPEKKSDVTEDADTISNSDMHRHVFKSDIDKIKNEVSSIYPKSAGYYYNENSEWELKELARGKGQGVGGAKQGDGGNTKCTCPKCGNTMTKERGTTCISLTCSKCGAKMSGVSTKANEYAISSDLTDNDKSYFPIDTIRQAEIALNQVSQLNECPSWYKGGLKDLQSKAYSSIQKEYSAVGIYREKYKDIDFSFVLPSWKDGVLISLQKKFCSDKKDEPLIEVKGQKEFYAIRFKEEGDAFFHFIETKNIETAKQDAAIYTKELSSMRVDLVKFESKANGEFKFTDLGNIVLYDSKKSKYESFSNEINLSEKDKNGNVIIELLREGQFNHEVYGKIDISDNFMNQLIKNFNDRVTNRDVSFDMNHIYTMPAAAWVKKLSKTKRIIKGKNRLVLNGHVELTPGGEKSIKDKEFKYFSAEYSNNFLDKETGEDYGVTLKGGGLTNRPWMPGLAPVQLSEISKNVGFFSKF